MPITVVGSVAFDTVETPAGRRERCLAGAATYFSLAASYFAPVRVIAVVGEDFGSAEEAVFAARGVDIRGIERAPGKSFFWQGSYLDNLNEAKTLQTDLNVFAGFEPKIPAAYADSDFLFLANIDPVLQRRVREATPLCNCSISSCCLASGLAGRKADRSALKFERAMTPMPASTISSHRPSASQACRGPRACVMGAPPPARWS